MQPAMMMFSSKYWARRGFSLDSALPEERPAGLAVSAGAGSGVGEGEPGSARSRLGKEGWRDGSRAARAPRCSRGSALRGQAAALGFNQRCFGSGFKPRQKFCWSREPPRSAARRRGPAQVPVMLGFDSPAVLPLALCCTRSTHRVKARVSLLPRCLKTSIVATRVSVFLLLAPPSRAGATSAWVIPSMGHASVCLQVKGFEQVCFIDNNRKC